MRTASDGKGHLRALVCALGVLGSLVGGCAGPPGPSLEGSATAPSATASPAGSAASASPSPSPVEASLAFTFNGADPVVTRATTGVDELYINPGAILEEDGRLHMYANVFTAWPGDIHVAHLVSEDGIAWDLAEPGPVLSGDDVPFTKSGIDVSTGFIASDGTWVLVFETIETGKPWVLGRATATGPDGPWTVDETPILEPGAAGSWDAGGLSWPSAVVTAEGYSLYFTGLDRPSRRGAIGLATSSDGMTWSKHDGPVFEAELAWERRGLDRPRVVDTRRGLAMVYSGLRLTDRGLAWSDDGMTWRRDGDVPIITADTFPVEGQAWDAALIDRDGTLYYYLEIGSASGTNGTQVYLATAPIR